MYVKVRDRIKFALKSVNFDFEVWLKFVAILLKKKLVCGEKAQLSWFNRNVKTNGFLRTALALPEYKNSIQHEITMKNKKFQTT